MTGSAHGRPGARAGSAETADAPGGGRRHGLPPAAGPHTRILILGSLPGERSLAEGAYYAHPQNRFWRVMEQLTGLDLVARPPAERLALLGSVGIGLWDVAASAHRLGSLDSSLRKVELADLNSLRSGLPLLRVVAFNGKRAASLGQRWASGLDVPALGLPSTSAASRLGLAELMHHWAVLRAWLNP